MKEISAIVSAYQSAQNAALQVVLATVVHVEGSSYRRAGARMLIDEYGRMTGAISGGCLEGDALQKALYSLHIQQNKLVKYDTSDESDAVIGAQLGCNGIIQVLFEPITEQHNPILLLEQAIASRTEALLLTLFQIQGEQHLGTVLLSTQTELKSNLPEDFFLKKEIDQEIEHCKQSQVSSFIQFEGEKSIQNAFFQYLNPAIQLVIVGAGHDAIELANLANTIGWEVVITDGRPTHANQSRFTSCTVIVTEPEHVLREVQVDRNTAFVLLSHNYHYDLAVLEVLLSTLKTKQYIGILGPRQKYERMQADLIKSGLQKEYESMKQQIFAPIGLQIGAESPAEIALSIIAEIQAYFTNSKPEHLSKLEGPIHKHASQQFKTVSVCK